MERRTANLPEQLQEFATQPRKPQRIALSVKGLGFSIHYSILKIYRDRGKENGNY